MKFIDLGIKNINSYNEFEIKAKETSSIYIARAFAPITFEKFNFLTYIKSPNEFWKFIDSQQEFRFSYYGKRIFKFTDTELKLIKKISLNIGDIFKDFNRKTIPIGINHQLGSITTMRILEQLKDKNDDLSSVLEVGGGSGMLGHMCYARGFKYSNFEVTQSFYTLNATVFKYLYLDKFTDTHKVNVGENNFEKKEIDNQLTIIPWWHFVNLEFPLPKFRVVVMNHCFFEISKKALAFIITRLANEINGRVYLIVSGWGDSRFTDIDNNFLQWLEKEFDFRAEDIVGDMWIKSTRTSLFSFQKKKSKITNIYSLPIDQRFGVQENIEKNHTRSKFINYIKKNANEYKKLIRSYFNLNKKNSEFFILGKNEPKIISEKFDSSKYSKNYDDLKILISEIESELGKPCYTEDEAYGFYISRPDHI